MQSLIRSISAGVTGGRGTAGAGPGRDLLYTSAANTHATIHTTTNRTHDGPRCRHLQHSYHHHHDPGTE